MKNIINITVKGETGSGYSQVIKIIEKALDEANSKELLCRFDLVQLHSHTKEYNRNYIKTNKPRLLDKHNDCTDRFIIRKLNK